MTVIERQRFENVCASVSLQNLRDAYAAGLITAQEFHQKTSEVIEYNSNNA